MIGFIYKYNDGLFVTNCHDSTEVKSRNDALYFNPWKKNGADSAKEWDDIGTAYSRLGNYPNEALEAFNSALKINPNLAKLWYNKGYTLLELERYTDALNCFDQAIKLDPKDPASWNNKGYALKKLDKFPDALEVFIHCNKLMPNWQEIWFNKGTMFFLLSRYEEALESFNYVISNIESSSIKNYALGFKKAALDELKKSTL